MRTQIWIIGAAFAVFGVVGWVIMQAFSPVYLGLMATGLAVIVGGTFAND
jgi:hypothetical protein